MLLNFVFKNYMSFVNECNFTMLANKDNSHENLLSEINKERISKAHIIYGANASGKSNFVKAINFISTFVSRSNILLDKMDIEVMPFKFRKDAYNTPSDFSITFYKNSLKYAYSFSCFRDRILTEKLEIYYSAKPTRIFERTNTNDYKFFTDNKLLTDIKSRNSSNKLFLVTSATWNYEKTKPVVDFLRDDLVSIYDMDNLWKVYLDKIMANNELKEYKQFCLSLLNNADISINDFNIDSKKIKDLGKETEEITNLLKIVSNGNEELINDYYNSNVYNFITTHEIEDNEIKHKYNLSLSEESYGTMQMFKISPLLYYVFKEGKVLLIDEIDKSLHPMLVEYLIKLFFNLEFNKNNAQLIANTHDTNLLNLEIFRRDEIWFAEKNYKTGASEMYSLADFSVRKNENIEKAYLLGRYGAVPFIKGE